MNHKNNIFEVDLPDSLYASIIEARSDIAEGRVYSETETLAALGLT